MRFLCLQPHSAVSEELAGRSWWFVALPNEVEPADLARFSAVLVVTGNGLERDEMQRWASRVRAAIPVFVVDPESSDKELARWLDVGASGVFQSLECAAEIMEEFFAPPPAVGGTRLAGCSAEIAGVREKIRLVAARNCGVLIEGETGTGKELVARAIHSQSERRNGPWVTVNCAAIPEALLEAELFGHVKGAFTGAIQGRAGKFEIANRGTIFLDEIGDMPLSVQSKLLRVLQEKEIERLGGNDRVRLDVRVIAATNARLEEAVRAGRFRQDLFYRLNVVRINIAPLYRRSGDVELLARKFLLRVCQAEAMPAKHLSARAMALLESHNWPGNVRELEHAIESAAILSGERRVLQPDDFALEQRFEMSTETGTGFELPSGGFAYQDALEDFERSLLTQALTRVRGNKTAAAELLGMKRTTLTAKLKILQNRMPRLVA